MSQPVKIPQILELVLAKLHMRELEPLLKVPMEDLTRAEQTEMLAMRTDAKRLQAKIDALEAKVNSAKPPEGFR